MLLQVALALALVASPALAQRPKPCLIDQYVSLTGVPRESKALFQAMTPPERLIQRFNVTNFKRIGKDLDSMKVFVDCFDPARTTPKTRCCNDKVYFVVRSIKKLFDPNLGCVRCKDAKRLNAIVTEIGSHLQVANNKDYQKLLQHVQVHLM